MTPEQAEAIARVEDALATAGIVWTAWLPGLGKVTYADLRLLLSLARQVGGLRDVLERARETIKALHGPTAWDIYDRCSPEMKAINAALRPDQSNSVET